MPGQTYADAELACEQLMRRLRWHQRRKVNGTALERLPDGGWGIVLLLDHHMRKPLPVPRELAGVPVRVAEVGPIQALASP
jgi:hypothetical protein